MSEETCFLNLSPNKNGKVPEPTLISKVDYEELSKFKWHLDQFGYIKGKVNNINWSMHRYIMIRILGHVELQSYNKVDHINGIKIDNRRSNLRNATDSENARNKTKSKNASSQYYGVSKLRDKWRIRTKVDGREVSYTYDKEIDAAWHYNLWITENNLLFEKKNDITEPNGFVRKYNVSKRKDNSLPKHIFREGNKFRVEYKSKYVGAYTDLEDAKKALAVAKLKVEEDKLVGILSSPILRNSFGQAIFEMFNKKGIKIGETIIDDDDYYELMKTPVSLSNGYAHTKINNKTCKLHRVIMNCYDKAKVVDHINRNPLDNRKENLRVTNQLNNSKNKSKSKNATSKYIGVNWDKNKWIAAITVNYKQFRLGTFNSEEDAARARDKATKEHFGEIGKLNFPIEKEN